MVYVLLFLTSFSFDLWGSELQCPITISSVSELDECLKKNNLKPTKSIKEILEWKRRLNISSSMQIEVEKVQAIVAENCTGNESQKFLATKLAEEVGKILQAGSLQIKDWKVPDFPATGAKDYSMKSSRGCDVKDLLYHMKSDVDQLLPDLMNVYNLGLAIDTTSS